MVLFLTCLSAYSRVQFNTPVQLGPTSPTRPRDAHVFTIPVEADDILILASDGLSDNLWDEDVLDEVVRFRQPYLAQGGMAAQGVFCQSTLAAMLSEALCSRAHCVAEHKARKGAPTLEAEEIPFARRAREEGRSFHGGKPDGESDHHVILRGADRLFRYLRSCRYRLPRCFLGRRIER